MLLSHQVLGQPFGQGYDRQDRRHTEGGGKHAGVADIQSLDLGLLVVIDDLADRRTATGVAGFIDTPEDRLRFGPGRDR